MRKLKTIFAFAVTINLIFLGTLLSETNNEDELEMDNEKENSGTLLELEELDTKTILSMDKEIIFPRDIWVHYINFLKTGIFYLVFSLYSYQS